MLKTLFFSILFLFQISFSFSQSDNNQFENIEQKLKEQFNQILNQKNDSIKLVINDSIIATFDSILLLSESYKLGFDKLINIGKIYAPDKTFRIINWNLNFQDGTYKYFGYIQFFDQKKNAINLFPLIDKSDVISNPKQATLSNENWYGTLYYKILLNNVGKEKYYTLLGWDGNDNFTNKKIIDILYFTGSGKPKFGKNIFKINNQKMKRVIFEYNNRALLTLRYDEHLKMIVYEHLSPEKPSQIGQYKFYIPDFSYDGIEFKSGKYIQHSDIDVYDQKQKNKKQLLELKKKRNNNSF